MENCIYQIEDLSAPALDVYARLTETALRCRAEPEKGVFIAESPKVIATALDAGCVPVSFLMEARHITGDAATLLARCPGTPVYTGARAVLQNLTGYALTHGVLCAMHRPAPQNAAALCEKASRLAVLEGVVDATNIGAIFRSAAALGMDAVLLDPGCCDPLCRRAVRVSMGTVFQIPWARLTDIAALRDWGFCTVAMALREDAVAIDDPRLRAQPRLAVLLGAEGHGLCAQTLALCDYTVCIPMRHGVDSLNVAAASALAFWALRGQ